MNNLIGGLFDTQESANRAYEALQESGFAEDAVNMYVHKPRQRTERSTEVSIQEIGRNAFLGALIMGTIGGIIGLLIGTGALSHPFLEPGSAPRDPLFTFMSVVWGIIPGVLIGAILGAASRLLRSKEKAEVMTEQIQKRGVLIAVDVSDSQSEARARRVMEEYKAIEVGNPQEKWDLSMWVSPNENRPSLAETRSS